MYTLPILFGIGNVKSSILCCRNPRIRKLDLNLKLAEFSWRCGRDNVRVPDAETHCHYFLVCCTFPFTLAAAGWRPYRVSFCVSLMYCMICSSEDFDQHLSHFRQTSCVQWFWFLDPARGGATELASPLAAWSAAGLLPSCRQ